jgi:peptide/nickel transport system permease protein
MSQVSKLQVVPFDADRKRISGFTSMRRSILRAKTPIFGLVVLLIVIICAVGAKWIVPYDPNLINLKVRLLPPAFTVGGNPAYPLGTDDLGRDVLSRLIYGAQVSLLVGVVAVAIAGFIGISVGMIAGFSGGIVDDIIMRLADIQLAFPFILLTISVLAVLTANSAAGSNSRLIPLILTLGVAQWVSYARMARGMTLSLREKEFVDAARALGDSKISIIFRNIFPNALGPLIVLASFNVASTILAEASLSFLGLGVPQTVPTWGGMLAESRDMLLTGVWWLAVIPGFAIVLTVLAINVLGDWLRDYYDPRLRS